MANATLDRDLVSEIIGSFQPHNFSVAIDSRKQALTNFQKLGLPTNKSEEYRFTPSAKNLSKNSSWKANATPSNIESVEAFLIKDVEASVVVLINGVYSASLSNIKHNESEISILPLAEAFGAYPSVIAEHFGKHLPTESDSFVALNGAFWQEGVFIHVKENAAVEKPVLILHVNDAKTEPVNAQTRLLTILEKNSTLSIIEKFDSVGSHPVFHNFCEELVVKENARLEYGKVQNDSGNRVQVANTVIHQSDTSKVDTFTLTLDGEIIRNNLAIVIDGENCESHFHGLYLLQGGTLADNHTVVDHKRPNSFSNELYKGIMDGQAKGIFNGKIFVRPQAQKTNAFQSNRNILLSDTATVNTKPQLEIWADDVKCSHGCTSGQLDEEALFYLRSRGIPADTAKAMLLYAFALDVLTPVKNEALKSYFDGLISDRLHKNF
ncbi:MAG: Fe-S cluster assembly protein SufD [Flammeovirgaceae bacterium]